MSSISSGRLWALLHGCLVGALVISSQGCSGGCRACASSPVSSVDLVPSNTPGIQGIDVPPQLSALTSNPELSGVVWAESLQRYLVVSDDTGLDSEGSNHAPIVFALTLASALDAEPISIAGISKLNDPESICQGPDNTFFLVTSHSKNTKGKLPAHRRLLLQARLQGRELQVMGKADLTEAKASDGAGLLGIAGLDSSGNLDIEAIAYHDQALYIGLKAPLNSAGEATILKLNHPVQQLAQGLEVGGLVRWRTVALCLPGPSGAQVCEGISDMAFLPDGSLVLTGNAPKGSTPDGGGALWSLSSPQDNTTKPRLIRHFDGLKPEGVTLSADGKSLVLVFDRDRKQPAWLQVPLPL